MKEILKEKLFSLINLFFNDKTLKKKILSTQKQYSDKDIFKNLKILIEKILNEKINLGSERYYPFRWDWRYRHEWPSSNNE